MVERQYSSKDKAQFFELTHKLKKGETLYAIAKKESVSLADLLEANKLNDKQARSLQIGRVIVIPPKIQAFSKSDSSMQPKLEIKKEEKSDLKPVSQLAKFTAEVLGEKYQRDAVCNSIQPSTESSFDCVTLIIAYLRTKGVSIKAGRTDRGDKLHNDHLESYARLTTSPDTKELICESVDGKKKLSRADIKEGDIVLIGHPYSLAEKGFSVYHLGIVTYKRNEEGKVLKGKDGEPLLYMLHANSTKRYGQESVVTTTGLRSYLAQRKNDEKRSDESKVHYGQMLICRIKDQ